MCNREVFQVMIPSFQAEFILHGRSLILQRVGANVGMYTDITHIAQVTSIILKLQTTHCYVSYRWFSVQH